VTAAIATAELTKYYGPVVGLEPLSLEVQQGEVFGFLGANGAGKTTTIRMLVDLLRPTSGSASILGFDCRRQSMDARRRVGYLPGEMPIYPELTGAAYLRFLASLGPAPAAGRIDALLRRFDVSDLDLSRPMREYSHGMKRKLGIIQALMANAPVIILDEPTAGLDPLMIEAFSQTIDDLARSGGTTVFLSSHILSEVERVCHRVGLIRSGRLTAVRSLDELRASAPRRLTVRFAQPVHGSLPFPLDVVIVRREPHHVVMDIRGEIGPLISTLAALPVADIDLTTLTVEDELLRLFGEAQAC